MLQTTLTAFDECYKLFAEIKKGTKKESELKELFNTLSYLDYRTEYEKKIQAYINYFYLSDYNDKNFNEMCRKFLKEHFKYVRTPFWKEYKKVWKKGYHLPFVSKSPSEILNECKKIEGKNDANKRTKK